MPRTRLPAGGKTDRRLRKLPGASIRGSLRDIDRADDLRSDLLGGIVLGIVRLTVSFDVVVSMTAGVLRDRPRASAGQVRRPPCTLWGPGVARSVA